MIKRLTGSLGSTVKVPGCEVSVSTRDKVFDFSGTQFPHLQNSINNNNILTTCTVFLKLSMWYTFEEHYPFATMVVIIVNVG